MDCYNPIETHGSSSVRLSEQCVAKRFNLRDSRCISLTLVATPLVSSLPGALHWSWSSPNSAACIVNSVLMVAR